MKVVDKGTLKIKTSRRMTYCENVMMSFCVLVKGPCRGKQCDFWARVKLRKRSVKELVREIYDSIIECEDGRALNIEIALDQFWTAIGVKDMERLCFEEPDLCTKIKKVENLVKT